METKVLQEMGLTENEARVYLFLLEHGQSNVSALVRTLPIHRVNLYDLLKRLIEKGLVSFVFEGRSKKYAATAPR